MPPRPHPVVLTALVAACMFIVLLLLPGALAHAASPGAHATWRWPLRGPVVGSFRLTPGAPYARGQRRGIDVAASPGGAVRAACAGRVTFAGAVPRFGLAMSVRCGALVATYLRLGRVVVRRGASVAVGQPLGTLGPAGVLRLGARRASDRRGYVDPLALLRDPRPATPPGLAPPRPRRPRAPVTPLAARPRIRVGARAARSRAVQPRRTPHPLRPRLSPAPVVAAPSRTAVRPARPASAALPWPAYLALALIASALPVGGLVHHRRRRTRSLVAQGARRLAG